MTLAVVLLSLALLATWMAWGLAGHRARRERARQAAELAQLRSAPATLLDERERRLQAILDSMAEGIIVLDEQNRAVMANQAAARLFCFPLSAGDRVFIELVRNHEIAALAARLRDAAAPAIRDYELRLESPGAEPRFLQINASALRNPTGGPAGAVFVFHDITRLRELEGMRQEFVANVSHELRTPLSLISGAVETLLDGAQDDADARNRLLAIIERHAQRLRLLIDDLLLLARLDSGQLALAPQPVTLRQLTQEVIEDIAPRAQTRGVLLRNDVPPELVARADADRLQQVLWNLIDNAIKYGRSEGCARVGGRELGADRVELFVQDDGAGIPPDARERVFERFFRVDRARSREQGGTGLGLAIVKHVVQAHGGEVRVESEPGHGTTFFFTLPRA